MTEGPDFTPREAWSRFVDRKRVETTEQSAEAYFYRLRLFVEWCEDEQIDNVDDLTGWHFAEYETARRGRDISILTLDKEMGTLRRFIEYLERIEAVEDGLAEKVPEVRVPRDAKSSDTKLDVSAANRLLDYYRSHGRGTRGHAFLELAWHTGARLGALRALDRHDFYPDEQYIEFRHRPESDTPLKNKTEGERVVGLTPDVVDAVQEYIDGDRWDKRDEHGREPLLSSRQGRPGINTIRRMSYQVTLPCNYGECPHGQEIAECDYREPNHESKCPSSRSPHRIRTGSISWQLDCGIPIEIVSERANVARRTLEHHYDKTSPRERMERRRRHHLEKLSFDFES
ncbi:site-specific integrase [Haloarculaceae archaeon H-GB2-1]|nr:site-specific integrase [Haloarculaceae archaeon H-GB1-1]MEA5406362.1 site-specific integrase [Haloarculaceae archaeon H-GB2-1]